MPPHRVRHRNRWQVGRRSHRTPARPRPQVPGGATAGAYTSRASLVAITAQRALAAGLLELPLAATTTPMTATEGPSPSRLPLRGGCNLTRDLRHLRVKKVWRKKIKGPDNPTRQLLPIMSTKCCSGDGERRKDKGGGERSKS